MPGEDAARPPRIVSISRGRLIVTAPALRMLIGRSGDVVSMRERIAAVTSSIGCVPSSRSTIPARS